MSIKDYLQLKHSIPYYEEKAQQYRQRAVALSLVKTLNASDISEVVNPQDNLVFYDGLYRGRVEDDLFYAADTEKAEKLLETSNMYERIAQSPLRRLIRFPFRKFDDRMSKIDLMLQDTVISAELVRHRTLSLTEAMQEPK